MFGFLEEDLFVCGPLLLLAGYWVWIKSVRKLYCRRNVFMYRLLLKIGMLSVVLVGCLLLFSALNRSSFYGIYILAWMLFILPPFIITMTKLAFDEAKGKEERKKNVN